MCADLRPFNPPALVVLMYFSKYVICNKVKVELKLSYAWHHTKKCDDSVVVFRPVALFSASEKAETSPSTICICHCFSILMTFRRPFLDIFFACTGYSLDELSDISSSLNLLKALSLRCLQ